MAVVNVGVFITSTYKGSPGFKKAEKDVKKFRKNVGRAANSVRAFQFVLAGVTISTLSIWGKKIVGVASELQLLQIRLNNVEGSAKSGAKQFQNLFQKFKTAPFEIDKVIDGFVRLRAAGIATGLATETMENLVDAVAAFGGTTQELQRATIGFQQVAGKGVLSMEELRQQIGEAVPSAMVLMARSAKLTVGQFVEQVKDGMIAASDAIRFFNEGAKEAFGGFAESLRFTIVGALQGLKSEVRLGLNDLFNVRTDASARIASALKVLTDQISLFLQSLDQDSVESFWRTFEGVSKLVSGVAFALSNLAVAFIDIVGMIGNAVGAGGGTALALGAITAMFFGRKTGFIFALFSLVILKLNQMDQAIKSLSATAKDELRAIERERVRILKDMKMDPRERDRLLDQLFARRQEIVKGGAKGPFDQFAQILEDTKKGLNEMEFSGVLAGILGLGAGVADLTEDLITLSDKSARSANNFGVPWISALDRMQKKTEKLASQITPLREKLDEEFRTRGRDIRENESLTIDQVAAALTKLTERYDEAVASADDLGSRVEVVNDNLRRFIKINKDKSFREMSLELSKMSTRAMAATGVMNEFQIEIANANTESAQAAKKMDDLIVKLEALSTLDDREKAILAEMIALRGKEGQVRLANIDKIKTAQEFRIKNLRLETDILRANTAEEIRQLKLENTFGVKNLMNSELQNEVLSRKAALHAQVLEIQQQILTIQEQLTLLMLHPDVRAELEKQLELWRQKKKAIEEVAQTVTEEALLEQQLWRDLGRIMEDGVGNAIKGLIDGTKTLKEAMLDMWSAAVSAAARYIIKLLIIKAIELATGGATGGGSSFMTALAHGNPFAKGGVFQGNVKPFANGDIIRGPTMFGLAGEAGTEAIMPLSRGPGGKLGVRSDGGGGDNYHVTIQALDTQTGVQFLLDNIPTIVAGMEQETALNRGMRRAVG